MVHEIRRTEAGDLVIPVDPYPTNLRALLFGIFIVASIAGFFLTDALFGLGGCSLLTFFGALGVGVLVMMISERLLRPRWSSQRFVELSPNELRVVYKGDQEQVIDPQQHVNVLMWRFKIERRARVPQGWFVVAIALEQDDLFLPVYTLVSPETFESMAHTDHYKALETRKERRARKNDDLLLAGLQRRLMTAEMARSIEGVEMTPENYGAYIDWLRQNFPQWMPSH